MTSPPVSVRELCVSSSGGQFCYWARSLHHFTMSGPSVGTPALAQAQLVAARHHVAAMAGLPAGGTAPRPQPPPQAVADGAPRMGNPQPNAHLVFMLGRSPPIIERLKARNTKRVEACTLSLSHREIVHTPHKETRDVFPFASCPHRRETPSRLLRVGFSSRHSLWILEKCCCDVPG